MATISKAEIQAALMVDRLIGDGINECQQLGSLRAKVPWKDLEGMVDKIQSYGKDLQKWSQIIVGEKSERQVPNYLKFREAFQSAVVNYDVLIRSAKTEQECPKK